MTDLDPPVIEDDLLWFHSFEGTTGKDDGITMTVIIQSTELPEVMTGRSHPLPWGDTTLQLAYKQSTLDDPSAFEDSGEDDDWEDEDPD